jgi:hypothetical protein
MAWRPEKSLALAAVALSAACAVHGDPPPPAAAPEAASTIMNPIADRYVALVLALGVHDADYVDAYYGPPEKRTAAAALKLPLPRIRESAVDLLAALKAAPPDGAELHVLRHQYLTRQLQALVSRVDMLSGVKMSFDEESQALYDAKAPHLGEEHFRPILAELDRLLPGPGPLIDRYTAFRNGFVIPKDKLDAVFTAAIDECRRRTIPHVDLPAGETFTVEYVTGKSWSAYNWYQGGFKSLIQVNTDLPIAIDRAIDLACHEGYPGHHVYNALLEKHLVRERGWPEFTVYPLFSPQSLIAEGTANYGIEVAFPGEERVRFERERLYPLAGLDPARAAEYDRVRRLVDRLSYAGNEAARRYLEGTLDAAATAAWLERYALMPADRARQRIRFFDQYRSYVINYNLGQDMARAYIESRGGTADHPEVRWREFTRLLASPRLPGGLKRAYALK